MAELFGLCSGTRLFLVQGDITCQDCAVIVDAANSGSLGGGGVDGAIHGAGGPAILEECQKIRTERGRCRPCGHHQWWQLEGWLRCACRMKYKKKAESQFSMKCRSGKYIAGGSILV